MLIKMISYLIINLSEKNLAYDYCLVCTTKA